MFEELSELHDRRQYAPATQRNREPILEVLLEVLPSNGTILEVSSGTGEHSIYFAPKLYPRQWIPSDRDPLAIASITGWQAHFPADNLLPPIVLDVCVPNWTDNFPRDSIAAIVNINMIHIAPWSACLGLMAGAQRILPNDGIIYLYGPFKQEGKHTSPSNSLFDESLRSQNPDWGVRNLEDVVAIAAQHNLSLKEIIAMPANNLSVVFQLDTKS